MNIGFFTDTYFPQISGVSTSIKLLRDQLIENGHRVIIFTTTDPNASIIENDIVRLPSIPLYSFKDRRIAYAGLDRAVHLAKNYQLDLVHTHTEFSLGLIGQFVASRLTIPIIHTYHTMYEKYTHYIFNGRLIKEKHVKRLSKWFCEHVHGVICPSQMTKDTLLSYGISTNIRVIPTGVKIPIYSKDNRLKYRQKHQFEDHHFVCLSLSRLSKEKNIDHLIKQFTKINEMMPNARLLIVGDGPERKNLEDLVKNINLEHVITFTGEVKHQDVHYYYQLADLYLNASDSESQGLTYLEALVNRLPICALKNHYLEGILQESPQLGALYEDSNQLADAALYFIEQITSHSNVMSDDNLALLSVETFANDVFNFYQEVSHNEVEQVSSDTKYFYGLMKNILANFPRTRKY